MGLKAAVLLSSVVMSLSAYAESTLTTKLGAEIWWPNTKVNEVDRENDTTPNVYATIEHDVKYVPDVRLRYSSVDADYMAFDKIDLTLYYQIFEHDLMSFDAGFTLSDLNDTHYRNADTNAQVNYDGVIWAWHGYAEIAVPDTQFDVIGEMNFGDSRGIKSTDLMAGVQYQPDWQDSRWLVKAGYRVVDLESDDFRVAEGSELGKPFVFADGWFLGAEYRL